MITQLEWKALHLLQPKQSGDYLVANKWAARVVAFFARDEKLVGRITEGWQDLSPNHIFTHWAEIPFPNLTRIVEPAVQLTTGRIFRGKLRVYKAMTAAKRGDRLRIGFLTSEGKFVNSHTAATLARAAGQVPNGVRSPKLGLMPSDLSC
jgi:hypothetical protein